MSAQTNVGRLKPRCGPAANRSLVRAVLAALTLAASCLPFAPVWEGVAAEINPPLGPYVNLAERHFADVPSYPATNRLVFTPYFYWYDSHTQAHLLNGDGSDALTDHPPTLEDFSYRSEAWHTAELRDMIDAGIDVVLPVYWGEPSQRLPGRPVSAQPWSFAGIPPLVAARHALEAEGLNPPRIGMFYDTSTLQYNQAGRQIDLTTPDGQEWFFESIRDFFSLIPPQDWALVDGRPVIFLYSASFASAHDQTSIDALRTAFAATFSREPYIVREISWNVASDQVYAWGGALGLKNPGVASLGPGYDHSAVPGRTPLVVDREEGAFLERNWVRFLRNPSNFVFVETWNEYHEGTDIAASREYGRQYIELNRKFVDLFRNGVVPPRPRGPFSDFKRVSVDLAAENVTHGVYQLESGDGVTAPTELGGSPCRSAEPTENAGRYVYFRMDDSFKWADRMVVEVSVEYFDEAGGGFTIEFDGSDLSAPFQGAYTRASQTTALQGGGTWKTAVYRLSGCRFLNSQNAGADFRIAIQGDVFHVRRVVVTRLGLPEEAGAILEGIQPDLTDPWPERWIVEGEPEAVAQPADGLLSVGATSPEPTRLSLREPAVEETEQSLLVRLRLRRPDLAGAIAGGLAIHDETSPIAALRLEFVQGNPLGIRLADEWSSREMFATYAWRPNTWYWVRVRHAVNRVTGYPDLWARLWLADGETLEPTTWQLYLDYCPLRPAQEGRLAITGPNGAGGFCETDFFLVRSAGETSMRALVAARKPAWLELQASLADAGAGVSLLLEGAPNQDYAILASPDLKDWTTGQVATDSWGLGRWQAASPAESPVAFYQARDDDTATWY